MHQHLTNGSTAVGRALSKMNESQVTFDPANARKRRIQLRGTKRSRSEVSESDESVVEISKLGNFEQSSISSMSARKCKKQARYDPEEPTGMTRSQVSEWRREARRVRNRESAAASRQKTSHKIDQLENEVSILQEKYSAALQFLLQVEQNRKISDALIPDIILKDLKIRDLDIHAMSWSDVPSVSSPVMSSKSFVTISPPDSPLPSAVTSSIILTSSSQGSVAMPICPLPSNATCDSFRERLNSAEMSVKVPFQHARFLQSPPTVESTMISRPTAVCV